MNQSERRLVPLRERQRTRWLPRLKSPRRAWGMMISWGFSEPECFWRMGLGLVEFRSEQRVPGKKALEQACGWRLQLRRPRRPAKKIGAGSKGRGMGSITVYQVRRS